MITIAPAMQYSVGDFVSRLEKMKVLFVLLEAILGIPFFPPFVFAQIRDGDL